MISIIFNTWNQKQTAEKYIPSIYESCGEPCELLRHDNASEEMADLKTDLLIQSETNIGCPAGLNKLLPYCKGEFIAKVDPDFIMPQNWGALAVEILNDCPQIGILGFYWARGKSHPDLQKGRWDYMGKHLIFEPTKVFGCWVLNRSVIDKVGCFYDKVLYGNWDSEFNARLKRNGYRNVYHRLDSVHMGVDNLSEREFKVGSQAGKEIPELTYYTSDNFDADKFGSTIIN